MEERDASPPSTFICLFQQSGPKQPIRLHTSPKKKRSSGSLALTTRSGPSTRAPVRGPQCRFPRAFSCGTSLPRRYRGGSGSQHRRPQLPLPRCRSQRGKLEATRPGISSTFWCTMMKCDILHLPSMQRCQSNLC